ncbi:MAG: endonuclease/exonuclease/phosphatase family protein [Chitinophagales bacterium]|nr:endonuclease/exonuclease/phosphatase family protein [Chitinophagales bacterium]
MQHLTIVTWNCNGALRKKFHLLDEVHADLHIIQECENPSQTNDANYIDWAKNYLWTGDNKNKGLGIFAKEHFNLSRLNWSPQYDENEAKYFLPCSVNDSFNLLAVWAHKNNSRKFEYIGQAWQYFTINTNELRNIIIAGDLNSNTIWDKPKRYWNHSDVVNMLSQKNIISLYHDFENEQQGKETTPTLFLQKNIEKPYHIDYIFSDLRILKDKSTLSIGKPEEWLKHSDHMPVIADLVFK